MSRGRILILAGLAALFAVAEARAQSVPAEAVGTWWPEPTPVVRAGFSLKIDRQGAVQMPEGCNTANAQLNLAGAGEGTLALGRKTDLYCRDHKTARGDQAAAQLLAGARVRLSGKDLMTFTPGEGKPVVFHRVN